MEKKKRKQRARPALTYRALNRLELTQEEATTAVTDAIRRLTRDQRKAFFESLESVQAQKIAG